jgi:hypothetical protein
VQRRRLLAWVLTSAAWVGVPAQAFAEPDAAKPDVPPKAGRQPEGPEVEEAKKLYAEAHDQFVAGRCSDAMPLLERANKLVPSPNSGLLMARCMVSDKQLVAAANRYGEVERDALNLVRAGETRYAETAAAAAKEGAALRAQLGTLRVRLRPRAGVALEIDGAPTEIQAEGETTLLHEPGQARVTFVLPATRRDRVVAINAGRESLVTYDVEEAKPPPGTLTPVPSRSGIPWTVLAAGGVSIAGFGTFAGFGIASETIYTDLRSKCAPACPESDRPDANRGRTFQTVANVGLVVGIVFAAMTAAAFTFSAP